MLFSKSKAQVVSDPSCFSSGMVNFHDPNMNVECPMPSLRSCRSEEGRRLAPGL